MGKAMMPFWLYNLAADWGWKRTARKYKVCQAARQAVRIDLNRTAVDMSTVAALKRRKPGKSVGAVGDGEQAALPRDLAVHGGDADAVVGGQRLVGRDGPVEAAVVGRGRGDGRDQGRPLNSWILTLALRIPSPLQVMAWATPRCQSAPAAGAVTRIMPLAMEKLLLTPFTLPSRVVTRTV